MAYKPDTYRSTVYSVPRPATGKTASESAAGIGQGVAGLASGIGGSLAGPKVSPSADGDLNCRCSLAEA